MVPFVGRELRTNGSHTHTRLMLRNLMSHLVQAWSFFYEPAIALAESEGMGIKAVGKGLQKGTAGAAQSLAKGLFGATYTRHAR